MPTATRAELRKLLNLGRTRNPVEAALRFLEVAQWFQQAGTPFTPATFDASKHLAGGWSVTRTDDPTGISNFSAWSSPDGVRTLANANPTAHYAQNWATAAQRSTFLAASFATVFDPATHNHAWLIRSFDRSSGFTPYSAWAVVTLHASSLPAAYPVQDAPPVSIPLPRVWPGYRPLPNLAEPAPLDRPGDLVLEVTPRPGARPETRLLPSVPRAKPPKGVDEGKGGGRPSSAAHAVLMALYKAADRAGEVSEVTEALAEASGWKPGMRDTPFGDRVDQLVWLFGADWGIGNLSVADIVGVVVANELQDRAFGKLNSLGDKARPYLGRSWDFGPAI